MYSIVSILTTSGLFSLSLFQIFFFHTHEVQTRKLNGKLYQSRFNFGGAVKLQDLFTVHLGFSTALQVAFLINYEVLCSCVLIFIM